MPALEIFRRRWLVADDDLFFPFLAEAIIRTVLAAATSFMIWIYYEHRNTSDDFKYTLLFLIILLVTFLLNIPLCGVLTWISGRGSVLQVERRSLLPKMLYTKIASFLFDLLLTIAAIYLTFFSDESSSLPPEIEVFIEVLLFFSAVYFAVIVSCIAASYSALGSSKYWSSPDNENCPDFNDRFFKKAGKTWFRRLKYLLCCLGCSEKNYAIYREFAAFLAHLFQHADLVPSDIFAGLVVLSRKHASERRRLKFMDSLCSHGYISSNDDSHPPWMTVENALYFLRLAKTAYGWPILLDTCNPCVLASKTRCFGFCSTENDIVGTDNCYNCNIAALQKATGYANEDFVYVSYNNSIYEPAFFVVIDKPKSAVVVIIRGSLSMSDVVTSFDADIEKIQLGSNEFYCHRGALRGALYIRQKLSDLRILKAVLVEYPEFNVVTIGHSLGGALSAVLGLLLREDYPNVQSYSFAPLPVVSPTGIRISLDFTLTVVVGDDVTPRISKTTCESLRMEIIKSLEECKIEKYKLMTNAVTKLLFKKKLFRAQNYPKNINTVRQNSVQSIQSCATTDSMGDTEKHLYTAGRILYLEKTCDGVKAFWKTGFHFHRIIVSLKMFTDHHPKRMQKFLEEIRCKTEKDSSAATNFAYCSSPELERKQTDNCQDAHLET